VQRKTGLEVNDQHNEFVRKETIRSTFEVAKRKYTQY
jgi:hypothetical protein